MPRDKELIKEEDNDNDDAMSKGHRSNVKELQVAKANTVWETMIVLHSNPEIKTNKPECIWI